MVFENELFQLIEYKPLTAKVLRAAAAVRAAVHQQVLHPRPAARQLADPLHGRAGPPGVRRQLAQPRREHGAARPGTTTSSTRRSARSRVVQEITGAQTINTLGFCVGGTILATALAVLAARGEQPARELTLLTTLLDFSDTGVLDIFIDEASVQLREMTLGPDSAERRRPAQGPGTGDDLQLPAPERPGVELRRRQLPEGRNAAAVRPAVLERRRHQPAGPDVLLVPAPHLPAERTGKPGTLTVCGEQVDLGGSTRRSTSTPRAKTTSCRGRAAYRSTQAAQGQDALRARRVGPHRRRHQPAGEEEAQLLDRQRQRLPATAAGMAGHARGNPGSWWPDWVAWLAATPARRSPRREARVTQPQGDRGGAGPLRQGESLNRSEPSINTSNPSSIFWRSP